MEEGERMANCITGDLIAPITTNSYVCGENDKSYELDNGTWRHLDCKKSLLV